MKVRRAYISCGHGARYVLANSDGNPGRVACVSSASNKAYFKGEEFGRRTKGMRCLSLGEGKE